MRRARDVTIIEEQESLQSSFKSPAKQFDYFDDPLHRETTFESSAGYQQNLPKKLIGEYLSALILHEQAIKEEKLNFYNLLNETGVTFKQLFMRFDTARKGYLTHIDVANITQI